MKKIFLIATLIWAGLMNAQDYGTLSGGFETSIQNYKDDEAIGAYAPSDTWASNNYFKLDYRYKKIGAGIQYEAYLPALQGYPDTFKGNKVANFYVSYQDDNFGITAGHIYEQYGSGLILRTWEDRQIGINNAVKGVSVWFKPVEQLTLKALYGNQRLNLTETGEGILRGFDADFDVLGAFQLESDFSLRLGGSLLSKYQGGYTGPADDFPSEVTSLSRRINIGYANFYINGEYVTKGNDVLSNGLNPYQDYYDNYYKGSALLLETGFAKKGLGINATFRRLENMNSRSDRNYITGTNNEVIVNYLPALTQQQDYSLANIYVYTAQTSYENFHSSVGEIGGQIDLFYKIKKGSTLGGKYGTRLSVNYAHWNGLKATIDPNLPEGPDIQTEFLQFGDKYFTELNVKIQKRWNKKFKSNLLFIHSYYDDAIFGTASHDVIKSKIAVGDFTYKLTAKKAVRLELQHLWTKEDKKNWMAGTLEYTVAPKWGVFAADMYNYGNDDSDKQLHYYNFGANYTKDATRLAVTYGRQRGGLLCVGGVCRYVPTASGLTITLNTSF